MTEVKKEFVLKFDNKELDDVTEIAAKDWAIFLTFDLAPGAGTLYVDDVKLIEK